MQETILKIGRQYPSHPVVCLPYRTVRTGAFLILKNNVKSEDKWLFVLYCIIDIGKIGTSRYRYGIYLLLYLFHFFLILSPAGFQAGDISECGGRQD